MPLDVWMKPVNGSLVPANHEDIEALRKIAGEMAVKCKINISRSKKHHRFFFAAIAEAHKNWPESHEFQTDHVERLRAWLLCKAGAPHREHLKYKTETNRTAKFMAEFIETILEHLGTNAFTSTSGEMVYVLYPKSIAWGKLDQEEFNGISQRVSDVLKEEIGMALDDFKKEVGKAA